VSVIFPPDAATAEVETVLFAMEMLSAELRLIAPALPSPVDEAFIVE
jgi:hypothetical protein